ncbi:MAG: DUF4410 domain-containing protein [Proteobacteria bacterium]|nr:DUF4410 domain-containing protein [Pseudomonadota bacterium]
MKAISYFILFLGLVVASGCATQRAMPVTSSGEKIHIDILSDRGNPSTMESRQWQYRNEVGSFMEPNMVRRLRDFGFSSALIQKNSDFQRRPGSYLLKMTITSYNPGSTAARILVGFGAGACSLDCHYELVDSNGKTVKSWDDGVGTSQNWQRLPITLNKRNAAKVQDYCMGSKP